MLYVEMCNISAYVVYIRRTTVIPDSIHKFSTNWFYRFQETNLPLAGYNQSTDCISLFPYNKILIFRYYKSFLILCNCDYPNTIFLSIQMFYNYAIRSWVMFIHVFTDWSFLLYDTYYFISCHTCNQLYIT